MLLGQLLKSVGKNYRKTYVRGICFDSRKVKKGYIFFAIRGQQTSGVNFINEAISKGASAIISDKKAKRKNYSIPFSSSLMFGPPIIMGIVGNFSFIHCPAYCDNE